MQLQYYTSKVQCRKNLPGGGGVASRQHTSRKTSAGNLYPLLETASIKIQSCAILIKKHHQFIRNLRYMD